MKKIFFVFLLLVTNLTFGQESMLDIVARETCEYLETSDIKKLSSTLRQQKLGLFIINKYNENEEQFRAEGIEIDFQDGSNSGRSFGEKVGMSMVKFCPEVLIALAGDVDEDEGLDQETYAVKGKIVKIVGEEFSSVILKDEQGKSQKFLWLQNFPGSDQLMEEDFKSKKLPEVELIFKNIECYSPKLNDYIIRKEIVEINFIQD